MTSSIRTEAGARARNARGDLPPAGGSRRDTARACVGRSASRSASAHSRPERTATMGNYGGPHGYEPRQSHGQYGERAPVAGTVRSRRPIRRRSSGHERVDVRLLPLPRPGDGGVENLHGRMDCFRGADLLVPPLLLDRPADEQEHSKVPRVSPYVNEEQLPLVLHARLRPSGESPLDRIESIEDLRHDLGEMVVSSFRPRGDVRERSFGGEAARPSTGGRTPHHLGTMLLGKRREPAAGRHRSAPERVPGKPGSGAGSARCLPKADQRPRRKPPSACRGRCPWTNPRSSGRSRVTEAFDRWLVRRAHLGERTRFGCRSLYT